MTLPGGSPINTDTSPPASSPIADKDASAQAQSQLPEELVRLLQGLIGARGRRQGLASMASSPEPAQPCATRYYGEGWEVSVHTHLKKLKTLPFKVGTSSMCSCHIQTNQGTILQFDVDKPHTATQERKMRQRVTRVLQVAHIPWTHLEMRDTDKGYHIQVRTSVRLTQTEAVALQAACGSDWLREASTLHRIRCWTVEPDLLFDAKDTHR